MNKLTQPISKLKSSKKLSSQAPSAPTTADQLILYLIDLADKKLTDDLLQKIKTAQHLTIDKRELAYIPIYYLLEQKIIADRNTTVEALHRDIATRFSLTNLSPYLRLLFVDKLQQSALLFKLAVDPYISNISQNIGDDRLNELIKSVTAQSPLTGLSVKNRQLDIEPILNNLTTVDPNTITSTYQKLFGKLYQTIAITLGENQALEIISKIFDFIKHTYKYIVAGTFLENIPSNLLNDDRITYLSREELENLVATRTSELKKSQEEELKKTKELLRLKDEFFFVATHDLRTPVTAISGFVELIKYQKSSFAPEIADDFEAITEATDRLKQLINDLLQITRSESGTMKVDVAPVDISSIIKTTIQEVTPPANEKKITIKSELDSVHVSVLADTKKLTEVIENLLSNAVKYNRHGGTITVKTQAVDNNLQITVTDSGYGIPADQQAKIFQKFFRAQSDTTKDVQGTGLGLFVVKMLVEKMGGTISFTSKENFGTTFTIGLRLVK